LALGPSSQVTSWQAYDINGYTFYTKAKDEKSVCQNSGVCIENVDTFGEVHTHFGFIEEIWELEYGSDISPCFGANGSNNQVAWRSTNLDSHMSTWIM